MLALTTTCVFPSVCHRQSIFRLFLPAPNCNLAAVRRSIMGRKKRPARSSLCLMGMEGFPPQRFVRPCLVRLLLPPRRSTDTRCAHLDPTQFAYNTLHKEFAQVLWRGNFSDMVGSALTHRYVGPGIAHN